MSEDRGYVVGPGARVCLVRRHEGYAVAVVLREGPFDKATAEQVAASLRRHTSATLTKAEVAAMLGISTKGVEYLRAQGVLSSVRGSNGRALFDAESVKAECDRRASDAQG